MCAKATIETVSLQYDGLSIYNSELKNEPAEITKNKLTDMLIGCPGFGNFFQSLETKDKRLFVNMCEIIEVRSEKKIINEYSPCHSVIIILKGELISFTRNGPGDIFKAGDILGTKEFLFDLCWKNNYYGRQNGYIVKIKRDYFNDLGNTFAKSAGHLIEYLVNTECCKIKQRYKDVQKPVQQNEFLLGDLEVNEEEEKMRKKAQSANRFVELMINQKIKQLPGMEGTVEKENDNLIKPREGAPIMNTPYYNSIIKMDAEVLAKKEANKKEEGNKDRHSYFISKKLADQYEEYKRRDRIRKQNRKRGLPVEEDPWFTSSKTAPKSAQPTLEALEVEYEKLKNDYTLRELSRERLNQDYEKALEKLAETEAKVKKMTDMNLTVTAQRDRLKLHKELINKVSEVHDGETFASKFTKSSYIHKNFNDVVEYTITIV